MKKWSSLNLGMHINAKVYRVFCTSVLSFLWQLEEVPSNMFKVEEWALRRMAPGPGNWIRPIELRHLQHRYGHPFSFPSFKQMSMSAKLRVMHFEPMLHLATKCTEIASMHQQAVYHRLTWADWFEHSPVNEFERLKAQARLKGITMQSIRHKITSNTQMKGDALDRHVKKKFQAYALDQILCSETYNHEAWLRQRLILVGTKDKSMQTAPIGILTRRAAHQIVNAFSLVSPRVAVVLNRSCCNGWCTASRFQNHSARCLFSCSSQFSQDDLRHYAYCPHVTQFASETLCIPHQFCGCLRSFLCLDAGIPDDIRILQLLLLYAVYCATNCLRNNSNLVGAVNVQELLRQFAHQGTFNHSQSQYVLNTTLHRRRNVRPRLTERIGEHLSNGLQAGRQQQQGASSACRFVAAAAPNAHNPFITHLQANEV